MDVEKVSFELRTVQLQRKVQFLQKKLIEKSSRQSESKQQTKYCQKESNKQNTLKLITEQKVKGLKEHQTIRRPLTSREETLTKIRQILKYYPRRYHIKRIAQKIPPLRDQSIMRTKEQTKTHVTIAGNSKLNCT